MESGSYKEFDSKSNTSSRLFAFLIASVTVVLCILIGVACYILVAGSNPAIPVGDSPNVVEEVVIVEEIEPKIPVPSEIDFKEGKSNAVEAAILEEVNDSIKQVEENRPAPRLAFRPEEHPFIRTLVDFSNNFASDIFSRIADSDHFTKIFDSEDDGSEEHSRKKRSIIGSMGATALTYLNYATFGRFMFNEVYSITEYAAEGRKLSGDPDAFFLDNGFMNQVDTKNTEVEPIKKVDTQTNIIHVDPTRLTSAFDDGWTPMVNKVSLKFITEMLTTLLNLMREYLMRDNVMECLWFMFCKDMNHQANYNDPMGYLARVNSVGLRVLTDKEGRETDTIRSVWEALTAWQPLDCDAMFPKCDGSKALEIVNEVANAARK